MQTFRIEKGNELRIFREEKSENADFRAEKKLLYAASLPDVIVCM